MANEAKLIYELELPVPFTVADGAGLEKGAILKLTDNMTVVINAGAGDLVAGIAASEKIANDGRVTLGVYLRGIFIGRAGGTITAGDVIQTETGGTNEFLTGAATSENAKGCGIALQDATDGQDFKFLLNVGIGGVIDT